MTTENEPLEEEQTGFTPQDKGLMEQVQDPSVDETTEEVYDNSKVDNLVPEEEVTMEATPETYLPRIAQKISIARMVVYRSRTGNYSVPAVVNCTADSIYQPGVEAGFVPPITAIDNVHLTVFSPGRPGMRIDAGEQPGTEAFVVPSKYPISENVSGCYQEWDIPYDEAGGPGTWSWPARV